MQTGHLTAIATILVGLNTICCLRPTRHLDSSSSNELMLEDGVLVPANPSCEDGWYYHNSSCYWFSTTRMDFHPAMESCAEKGAYLTDILSQEENQFLKDILMVINPKDGTDYWAGGVTKPHGLHWISGAPMIFNERLLQGSEQVPQVYPHEVLPGTLPGTQRTKKKIETIDISVISQSIKFSRYSKIYVYT